MEPIKCPTCGKHVQPSKDYCCPECNSFLHPDPIKRKEAKMAAQLHRWMIEELPKQGWILTSSFLDVLAHGVINYVNTR
ncbi:MAG: hypothetical protein ACFFCK_00015 [Promethearchaeota archaeon]